MAERNTIIICITSAGFMLTAPAVFGRYRVFYYKSISMSILKRSRPEALKG
jgi:hypothetical protein